MTLKADDDGDTVSMLFESEDGDRVSDFEMKLMDIDSEHLGIPETGAWRAGARGAPRGRSRPQLRTVGVQVRSVEGAPPRPVPRPRGCSV